jgi:methionyl-tRNA formyltransferase
VPLTVALAAEDAAGLQALRLVAGRDHRIAAVFTDSAAGESTASVATAVESMGLERRPVSELLDEGAAAWLRAERIELFLNVHSLPNPHPSVLEAPTIGAYNLHPGPLPEYAGLNAPSWAVYEGAPQHGVALHRMTAVQDAGPIAFEERFPIAAGDTGISVLMGCVRYGRGLLERLLDTAERGQPVPARAQDLSLRRWLDSGPPENGSLDWDRPAQRIVDFVRACDYRPFESPWGFPKCVLRGSEVAVVEAHVFAGEPDAEPGFVRRGADDVVLVAAADAWVRVDTVSADGEQVAAAEILAGGDRLAPHAVASRAGYGSALP